VPATAQPTPGPAPTLAVFPLEPKVGVKRAVADLVTEQMVDRVRRAGVFARVVEPRELAVLMSPAQQKSLVECANDACGVVDMDLAGALGVSHVLVGNVARVGNSYLLNARLISLASALTVSSVSDRVQGKSDETLFDLLPSVVERLVSESGLPPLAPLVPAAAVTPPVQASTAPAPATADALPGPRAATPSSGPGSLVKRRPLLLSGAGVAAGGAVAAAVAGLVAMLGASAWALAWGSRNPATRAVLTLDNVTPRALTPLRHVAWMTAGFPLAGCLLAVVLPGLAVAAVLAAAGVVAGP
jgi:TolB-like protein